MDLYLSEHGADGNGSSNRDENNGQADTNSGGNDESGVSLALQLARILAGIIGEEALDVNGGMSSEAALRIALENSEQDAQRAAPPASKAALKALPTIPASEDDTCPVCTELFEQGEPARKLPCEHVFHHDCIIPWLKKHCSCPLCRTRIEETEKNDRENEAERQSAVESLRNMMYN